MSILATPEKQGYLDLVPFPEKLPDMAQLRLVIVLLNICMELDFLQREVVLPLLGKPFLPLFLVPVFTVIHYPADRRVRVGRHLHQVELTLAGEALRLLRRDYAEHLAVGINTTHRGDPDSMVCSYERANNPPPFLCPQCGQQGPEPAASLPQGLVS